MPFCKKKQGTRSMAEYLMLQTYYLRCLPCDVRIVFVFYAQHLLFGWKKFISKKKNVENLNFPPNFNIRI